MLPTSLLHLGLGIIDKVIADPQQQQQAKLELLKQQQQGRLQEIESSLSILSQESASQDPLTSRARPCFLYVIYLMILAAIPMGILHALAPEFSTNTITGIKAWLAAIPESLWTLFGVGYLGYTGARSWDKRKL